MTPTRAHVITGSFGSGKTTAIRWLMAHKPEEEMWVVILNEFTDAGIETFLLQFQPFQREMRLFAQEIAPRVHALLGARGQAFHNEAARA